VNIEWYDVVGMIGVVLILLAYFLLQVGRINVSGLSYSVANLIGAGFITLSLLFKFNFSAFLIEVCWMAISIVGIAQYFRRRRAKKAARATLP
jgi:hypothetical protein